VQQQQQLLKQLLLYQDTYQLPVPFLKNFPIAALFFFSQQWFPPTVSHLWSKPGEWMK